MSMINGGYIGGGAMPKTIRLSDTAGVDRFTIEDGNGVPFFIALSNKKIKTSADFDRIR